MAGGPSNQPVWIREETLESGNLSPVVEFRPPYLQQGTDNLVNIFKDSLFHKFHILPYFLDFIVSFREIMLYIFNILKENDDWITGYPN